MSCLFNVYRNIYYLYKDVRFVLLSFDVVQLYVFHYVCVCCISKYSMWWMRGIWWFLEEVAWTFLNKNKSEILGKNVATIALAITNRSVILLWYIVNVLAIIIGHYHHHHHQYFCVLGLGFTLYWNWTLGFRTRWWILLPSKRLLSFQGLFPRNCHRHRHFHLYHNPV